MRVITEKSLQNSLFAEIQKIELKKGSCHYGEYKQWCISGEDVENAIRNIFAENDVFKPTKDLIHCNECKLRHTDDCAMYYKCDKCGGQWSWENNNDFCSYGERIGDGT